MEKRKYFKFLLVDIFILILILGIAYGAFSYAKPGAKVNRITAGAITMSYTESSNKISIANATPMSDASGEAMEGDGEYFDFTVSTSMTTSQPISYEVTAEKDNESTLLDDEVRLYLEKYETESAVASGESIDYEAVFSPMGFKQIDEANATGEDSLGAKNYEMLLDTGEVTTNKTVYYRLRMWIAEGYSHTQNEKSFQVTVNVYGKDVSVEGANGINLSKSSLTMQKGETKTITATITPESTKNKNLIWTSSNSQVAKVDSSGNITAVGVGTAAINVQTSDKSKSAECIVTVVDADAESVSLNTESITLVRGSTNQLTATVLPVDASDKSVTWSSASNGIATVSSTGLVTAVGIGVTTITVETVNGKTATVEVTVVAPSVDTITISGANTVDIGSTTQLSVANASGETSGEVSSLDLVWSSSDTTKATVSSNGLVTGIGSGQVTITASVKEYPDIYATKVITVQKPEIREITMSSNTTIHTGNSTIFMIALTPADVRNKSSITWESSNTSVATIPQECAGSTYCEVEGLAEGSTTIKAKTTTAIYDTATLTVKDSESTISSIDIIGHNKMYIGDTRQLTLKLHPIYASEEIDSRNPEVTWTSSDNSVATVNNNGLVTGINIGSATITATLKNGVNAKITFIVADTLAEYVDLGDYISMTPSYSGSYTCSSTGCGGTITPNELNIWRVIEKNNDGTVDIVSEYTSSTTIGFSGQDGYKNYVGILNTLATQYENSNYTKSIGGSRYFGYNGQTEFLTSFSSQGKNSTPILSDNVGDEYNDGLKGDTLYAKDYNAVNNTLNTLVAKNVSDKSTNSPYWIASRYYFYEYWYDDIYKWVGRWITESGALMTSLHGYDYNGHFYVCWRGCVDKSSSYYLRPILTLKSDALIISGDGKSEESSYSFE